MISAKSNGVKKTTKSLGFGFVPAETHIHFLVDIPRGDAKVSIYERSKWDDGTQRIDPRFDVVKVQLSKQKWEQVAPVLAKEFNDRLRAKHPEAAGRRVVSRVSVADSPDRYPKAGSNSTTGRISLDRRS